MTTATATAIHIAAEQAATYGPGMCLAVKEKNGYHDSYFSGLFAKEDGQGGYTFEWAETGATAYAGGYWPTKDVQEGPVLDAYRAKRESVLEALRLDNVDQEARTPTKGKTVTIVQPLTRGKNKTEAGVTGEVTWRGEDTFAGTSRYGVTSYRVGVTLEDGAKVFLSEDRVRVTGREDEMVGRIDRTIDYLVAASWPAA